VRWWLRRWGLERDEILAAAGVAAIKEEAAL
jgi:hypothetical protein